jgi:arsenite-transporting ATPase
MMLRQREAMEAMPGGIRELPRTIIALKRRNLVGLDAIRSLLVDEPVLADGAAVEPDGPIEVGLPPLINLIDQLEAMGHGAIMTMGKGGVGKTTIAAAIAVELAHRGHEVHLTTTDPAAHIAAAVGEGGGSLPNLTVDRIDPQAETKAYRDGVLAASAKDLDVAGLALLEEDLRSPCTEEVAVFRAFSRVLNEGKERFVVIDTAPTGHTLLLLDATGSYHREMMRQMSRLHPGDVSTSDGSPMVQSPATPMMKLQDGAYTKVILVTLAENTPVLEASRLQSDLRRAGIEPYAWVINSSLAATVTADPLLKTRARGERVMIEEVRLRQAQRTFIVPWQATPPTGAASLHELIGTNAS